MKRINGWIVVLLMITGLFLAACAQAPAEEEAIKPVRLEPIEGTDLNRVILTTDAAKRLDVQTATVGEEDINGAQRKVIPYAAVLYEPNGDTWVYVNIEPLVFVRQPIVIDYIEGDQAILLEGPDSGSVIVTVGAVELFGSESEFEEE